jgi:hypothetical protein
MLLEVTCRSVEAALSPLSAIWNDIDLLLLVVGYVGSRAAITGWS